MSRNGIVSIITGLVSRLNPTRLFQTGSSISVNKLRDPEALAIGRNDAFLHNQKIVYYTPIRDSFRALKLMNLEGVPEVDVITSILVRDCLTSSDGNDISFSIPKKMQDGREINPRIVEIGNKAINRIFPLSVSESIINEFLMYGDCFRSIMLDESFNFVARLKELPTFELFRIENDDGQLIEFQQRRYIGDIDEALRIEPAICCHWRYRKRRLYGRSIWETADELAETMARSYRSLDKASISVGANGTVHIMPESFSATDTKQYKSNYENLLKRGVTITDHFMYNGGDVKKLSTSWPNLSTLLENVDHHRKRITMLGRVPPWFLGIEQRASKDLSSQPMLAYVRYVSGIRQSFAEIAKKVIDMELILNGFYEADERVYRLVFPKLSLDIQDRGSMSEETEEGVSEPSSNSTSNGSSEPDDDLDDMSISEKISRLERLINDYNLLANR